MYYFAYGSNLNVYQMSERCPDAEPLTTAKLRNFSLEFFLHADVVDEPGAVTHGAIFKITRDCLESLDRYEGYPRYYIKRKVRVRGADGKRYRCIVYQMNPNMRRDQAPTKSYTECVRQGYRDFNLPVEDLFSSLTRCIRRLRERCSMRFLVDGRPRDFESDDELFEYLKSKDWEHARATDREYLDVVQERHETVSGNPIKLANRAQMIELLIQRGYIQRAN